MHGINAKGNYKCAAMERDDQHGETAITITDIVGYARDIVGNARVCDYRILINYLSFKKCPTVGDSRGNAIPKAEMVDVFDTPIEVSLSSTQSEE